ncbi:MAG: hypothetical protein CVT67_05895 [Actinobacteria bacterium HGW-Actinobacteria-7]|jgi:hypothetical protein|nr:MAG: hypothetical protein CVT67_05895 [Actinobacteria bacterium HGW-Actinobacteria-7]
MDYYDDEITVYGLVRDLFFAGAITCLLYALHRVAHGLVLSGRVRAYDELADAYTVEEREVLIHRIKQDSLRG